METHRVLIVDDSPTARALLRAILEADPDVRVVAEAGDGAEAIELVERLRPSLVVMDINMPNMGGFEATKRIMTERPTPIIVVTGTDAPEIEVEVSLQAVGAGALTVIPKPAGPSSPRYRAESARLVRLVKALADVKLVRQRRPRTDPAAAPRSRSVLPAAVGAGSIEIVGVAASTGGPAALYRFLQALPSSLDVPVLVVQHIALGFVAGLARWLDSGTVLRVSVASAHARLEPGHVYLAPDDRHLTVRDGGVVLSTAAPVGGFRPSANVLFQSLAESCGPRSAAVVLTGMGDDGVEGAELVHAAGGVVLAQDAESSVVNGMPDAVVSRGFATVIGPVEELASHVVSITSKKESTS